MGMVPLNIGSGEGSEIQVPLARTDNSVSLLSTNDNAGSHSDLLPQRP